MVYNFTYEIRRPGLIFILCDLSDKMKIVENQLQEAVNSLIVDYVNGCVSGNQIKNRLFIELIGYGNGVPHIIQQGRAEEWKETLISVHARREYIIKEHLENETECESVWNFVKNEIDEAMEYFLNSEFYRGLCSPHIINITNRKPTDEKKCEYYINEIKKFSYKHKNYYSGEIPKIMISTIILMDKYDNSSDILFMNREKTYNSKKIEFWKKVVSEIEIDLLIGHGICWDEEFHLLSCCAIHNAKQSSLYAYFTIGSYMQGRNYL